jgi:hypothetical protein
MKIVKVPKPSSDSMNQGRAVSGLLKSQILHLQEAEFRLPAKYQTNIYIHSIQTEGDAAEYIREVTERIHEAHASHSRRAKPKPQRERTFAIAAAAAKPRKKKAKRATAKKKKKSR